VPSPSNIGTVRGLPSSAVNVSGLDPLLAINLRKVLSEANLLANPRIRVRNREKAKIHVGDRVPYSTTTSSATTSLVTQNITYLDVGLKLEVEPQVFLDDDVAIKVALEVSSVVKDVQVGTGQTVPQVGTRTASTTLTLKSGETQILAGLIRDDEKLGSSRLPGLGDIPVLGRLFSNESTETEKTEILLSITPYVLRNIERPGPGLTEYPSGSEGGARTGASSAPAPARVGAGGTAIAPSPGVAGALTSIGTATGATGASGASGAGGAAASSAAAAVGSAAIPATPEFEAPPSISVPAGGPPGISAPAGG
jgi:general secretion pathway protein D